MRRAWRWAWWSAGGLCLCGFAPVTPAAPVLGLAYQPYVGQWSQTADNPYAPGSFYTPAFTSYRGGIDLEQPAHSLLAGRQAVDLRFDAQGKLTAVAAQGTLTFEPAALRNASAAEWSKGHFKFFEGMMARPATPTDNHASVYRQLEFLARQAGGAPLTLATYGSGIQSGDWRRIGGREYAVLPAWSENRVNFIPAGEGSTDRIQSIDELLFYFPPDAAYVRPAPERAMVETKGSAGRDLALQAVHLTVFAPARRGDPGAVLNPGFFAGDANAQVGLAAAEINARAGATRLAIKQGVANLVVDGSLVNDRMRFAIRAALAQARIANARHPGTLTHLIISNEYAEEREKTGSALTPTEQVTAMVRFAKAQMAAGGDFAGLELKVGVRGKRFRLLDPRSSSPPIRQFTQDVATLIQEADFLMENIYPSQEAVAAARDSGHWDAYFDREQGELAIQWRRLSETVARLAQGRRIELMIGEIGHPTNGISFNLPGYPTGESGPTPGSAFATVAAAIDTAGTSLQRSGIETFQTYFNDRLATAFLTGAFAWSRNAGVQIHVFEAFDEPHKSNPNVPRPDPSPRESLLNPSGPYGSEGFFGLFGYTGVADFKVRSEMPPACSPGARITDALSPGLDWASQFGGRLYAKLGGFDLAKAAAAFEPVTSP